MGAHSQFESIQMQWWQSRWQIWSVSNSGNSISPPWELFAMPSFLSRGQFCSLTDYIWRPAGLQNQLNSISFPYITEILHLVDYVFLKVCVSNQHSFPSQCGCGSKHAVCAEICMAIKHTGLKSSYISVSSTLCMHPCTTCTYTWLYVYMLFRTFYAYATLFKETLSSFLQVCITFGNWITATWTEIKIFPH